MFTEYMVTQTYNFLQKLHNEPFLAKTLQNIPPPPFHRTVS